MRRVPFTKDILIDGRLMVKGIDISEGGLYVHTGRSDMPGRIVDVEIPCEGETLRVRAKVSRSICAECDFFRAVQKEEGEGRQDTMIILGKLEE